MAVAFALAVTFVAGAVSARGTSGDAGRAAVEAALRAGQYEAALHLATRGRRRSDDAGRAVLASRALVALGRYAEARATLDAAVAAAPDDLPARDALMRLDALVGDRAAL
ncbi:MAG TPA: tetratricopeptide repeat protein, partial [Polyangia bacterium]|nr:tetratricopeptide repeat protein [Polyangia bacterium]